MPTPPTPPPAPPTTDPPPTDPPGDEDPRSILKGIVREVFDEVAAEHAASPDRTKPPRDFLRDLLGIKG